MKPPIEPVRRVSERRSEDRRAKERRDAERRLERAQERNRTAGASSKLPVPIKPAIAKPDPEAAGAAFAAQLMGQKGQKRGLKGGPPVLEEARSAYLGAEWSGPEDRRKRLGRIAKTEI